MHIIVRTAEVGDAKLERRRRIKPLPPLLFFRFAACSCGTGCCTGLPDSSRLWFAGSPVPPPAAPWLVIPPRSS